MTVHERPVGASVEWYTPRSLFDRIALTFDLDPAATPLGAPNAVPAATFYRWPPIDGTVAGWYGRVWLNPPYGPKAVPFIERMIEHDHGLLLIPARTETRIFQRAAHRASCTVFLRDRLHFVRPDGTSSRSSFASALLAFGLDLDVEMGFALQRADLGWTATNLLPEWAVWAGEGDAA
jgi:hypothetical protein